ncbi:MAG: alanine--tRNA ligase, partial [Thermus sp.]|uniref:alanine--tRNA ligase n=1 Tax=Thermus sp. TaxID=275 RepID=UPI003331ADED
TEHLRLDPDRLWVTVFEDDDEAYAIWRDLVGLPEERIGRFGEEENYWPGGAITHGPNGPSGPCSEIFYDRGPAFGTPDETGPNTGSGDRFVEIWNLVFTQYDRQGPIPGPGILKPLPQKNIDTGMGLYRVSAILQDVEDFYRTDTFFPLIEQVALWSGKPYEGRASVSHRVIADHVRAVVAALSDGATFSNTGRGYVVRRLLRRALRHGYLLGLKDPFLHRLAPLVAELLGDFYPEMRENLEAVTKQIRLEEERFLETLEGGVRRLEELLSALRPGEALPGEEAFRLYDTYGFPLDLTVEIAAERGFGVDTEGFEEAMRLQQERSRAAMAFERGIFKRSAQVLEELYEEKGGTEFVGYTDLEAEAEVLALLAGDGSLAEAKAGTEVQVVLDKTPFYAEGGGQVGDFGHLEWPGGRAKVETTRRTEQGIYLHRARVEEGVLRVGEKVRAVVDPRRRETERNHTATHLLHAALRAVLGPHVRQAGSLVAPDRLRFDFTHPEALGLEELERIERLVNRWIMADLPVRWTYKPLEEAKREGAMALFGEKYSEVVRVVEVAEASKELCGGTHVRRTGEIGAFFIVKEEAVSAGVRRVEALTGEGAVSFVQGMRRRLHRLADELGVGEALLEERFRRLKEELKAKEKEAEALKARLVQAELREGSVEEKGGLRYTVRNFPGLDMAALRQAADDLVARGVDVVLLFSGESAVLKLSKRAMEKGLDAGTLFRSLTERAGGRGGGKGSLAQGGGLDFARAQAALLEMI